MSRFLFPSPHPSYLFSLSEGFVDQSPASKRRARPAAGAYSIGAASTSAPHFSAFSSTTSYTSPSRSRATSRGQQQPPPGARHHQNSPTTPGAADDADSAGSSAEEEEAEETYDVAAILKVRVGRDRSQEYLVRWEGYTAEHDSWEPPENLARCTVFVDYLTALRAARALRNAGIVVSDAPPPSTASSSPATPPRKGSAQFATPRRASEHAASLRSKLLLANAPGARAGKSSGTRSSGALRGPGQVRGPGPGPVLSYHSPSKKLPQIWSQLVSGHFGAEGSSAHPQQQKQQQQQPPLPAPSAASAIMVPVALRKKGAGGASALSAASRTHAAAAAPRTPKAAGKVPPPPASARSAHHRKLQREIFARRHAAGTAATAAAAASAVGLKGAKVSALNARIAAVRAPTAAPAATVAVAPPKPPISPEQPAILAEAHGAERRPAWCHGTCHWTNCLCVPPNNA